MMKGHRKSLVALLFISLASALKPHALTQSLEKDEDLSPNHEEWNLRCEKESFIMALIGDHYNEESFLSKENEFLLGDDVSSQIPHSVKTYNGQTDQIISGSVDKAKVRDIPAIPTKISSIKSTEQSSLVYRSHNHDRIASHSSTRRVQTTDQCTNPLKVIQLPNSYTMEDYSNHRKQCTSRCNSRGYCCTLGLGACKNVPCNSGCHIAWFSESLEECKEQCAVANSDSCTYTDSNHVKIGSAGFNPRWKFGIGVFKCWAKQDPVSCGCPFDDIGDECSPNACIMGCEIAHEDGLRDLFYHGEDVVIDDHIGLDKDILLDVVDDVAAHVQGTKPLTEEKLKSKKILFMEHMKLLDADFEALDAAFNLVDSYEEEYGALFIGSRSVRGFDRERDGDGKELERFILVLMQAIIDEVYQGTPPEEEYQALDNYQPRVHDPIIKNCIEYLRGKSWKTANFFPGYVDLPDDSSIEYDTLINATVPKYWGRKYNYATDPIVLPTGLYLSAGGIATVIVPDELVGKSYHVQVGASSTNNRNKSEHRRLDRVTSMYKINNKKTFIASPLGGNIYIKVPYLANDGVVSVKITGDVIKSPLLSLTSLKETTDSEWNNDLRNSVAPFADFQTDHFLMQVPTIWVNGYNFDHLFKVLKGHDQALVGVSELVGVPIEKQNRHMLYLQPDLHIKHNSYGIGYPQVNNRMKCGPNGPLPEGPVGMSDHWLVAKPFLQWGVCWHELGHMIIHSWYRGEIEAIVNFLYAYVRNVYLEEDIHTAFMNSFGKISKFTPDRAAIDWMVTPQFRAGEEMDYSNTPDDQFKYQQRGYAKYIDITRLFGWKTFSDFNYHDNRDFHEDTEVDHGLNKVDDRTLRLSIEAKVDLTPLIHFWGIRPADKKALKMKMREYDLPHSNKVYNLLKHYASIIPMSRKEFIDFFESVYPGKLGTTIGCEDERYGCGWYNVWSEKFKKFHGKKAVGTVNKIIEKYFGCVDTDKTFKIDGVQLTCEDLQTSANSSACDHRKYTEMCPESCGICKEEPFHYYPTKSPTPVPTSSPPDRGCEDSLKGFLVGTKTLTCNNLRMEEYSSLCEESAYSSLCPNACGVNTCHIPVCKDAKGKVSVEATGGISKCKFMDADMCMSPTPQQLCPETCSPMRNSFSLDEYTEHRRQCIVECNEKGHCCNLGMGGCNKVPCATGCHIAWFSESLEKCYQQCDIANNPDLNKCYYTWNHEQVVDAGFNPAMNKYGKGVIKCKSPEDCGCPEDDFGNDCSPDACRVGCDLAYKQYLRCHFFNGDDVEIME